MVLEQLLPLRYKVVLGVIKMKAFLTLFRYLEQEPNHKIQFCVIYRIPIFGGTGILPFCRGYSLRV